MKTVECDGIRLLPQGVIPHFSHAKGGHCKGSGRKLGFCRGEGVSGDHGVNSWPLQKHGDYKWGLGSPALSPGDRSGPTLLYLFYALEEPVREGSSPELLESTGWPFPLPFGGVGGVWPKALMLKGCGLNYMPDLSVAQLRAAWRTAPGYIRSSYPRVADIIKRFDLWKSPRAKGAADRIERFDWWRIPRAKMAAGLYRPGGWCIPGRIRARPGGDPAGSGWRCLCSRQSLSERSTYIRIVPVSIPRNFPGRLVLKLSFVDKIFTVNTHIIISAGEEGAWPCIPEGGGQFRRN